MSALRIGVFAHSTNPRGGVVHAMQLAEALCDLGHDATLLAPGPAGKPFFRRTRCPSIVIPGMPASADVEQLVAMRRVEIAGFLRMSGAPCFDILHAQDSISALALSDLRDRKQITGFLRTVHHLDVFPNSRLAAWQDEAVRHADHLFCVSRAWQAELDRRFGRDSTFVGNGVDTGHFTPLPEARDVALRHRLLPQGGRMVLALGGIEARKNILGTLSAFLHVLDRHPGLDLHLVIAGGATLLDHSETRRRFGQLLGQSAHAGRVVLAGVIPDADMPSLYRNAAMLCFPSLREGFGLCVLEAMASGIPVIASEGAPFDEYLHPGDAICVDPLDNLSIAAAMLQALQPDTIRQAAINGPVRARTFDWQQVAGAHLAMYHHFQQELTHDA